MTYPKRLLKELGFSSEADLVKSYVSSIEAVNIFNRAAAKFDRQIFVGHGRTYIRTLDGKYLTWRQTPERAMKVVQDEFPALCLPEGVLEGAREALKEQQEQARALIREITGE
jgi:hypothetical protein